VIAAGRAAAVWACLICGCRGAALGAADDASWQAATAIPQEGGASVGIDAASPPDDAVLPSNTEELQTRARHLLEAITKDDATLAADILFPRDGWLATRDAADPGKDWQTHAAAPFRRAVHGLSRRHRDWEHAEAVSLQLGSTVAETVPRKHGWKKPLWTVGGSQLTFVAGGHTRTLPIREMVAWRGAWYVTRLR
jgi:hypothetical protein